MCCVLCDVVVMEVMKVMEVIEVVPCACGDAGGGGGQCMHVCACVYACMHTIVSIHLYSSTLPFCLKP